MGFIRDGSVQTPEGLYFYSDLVRDVSDGNLDRCIATIRNDAPETTWVKSSKASDAFPSFVAAGSVTYCVVVLAGAQSLPLATKYLNGFFINPSSPSLGYHAPNDYITGCATIVSQIIAQGGTNLGGTFVFAGHSVGGCIAEACCLNFPGQSAPGQGSQRSQRITFGSPRWADRAAATRVRNVDGIRLFDSDDPVPFLLPTFADAPSSVIGMPLPMILFAPSLAHTAGGLSINPNGTIDGQELPTDASMGLIIDLASWLSSAETTSFPNHGMAEYRRRISLYFASQQQPLGRITRLAPQENQEVVQRREVSREETRVSTIISTQQREQNAVPLAIPPAALFRVIRQGRSFAVAFGDRIVFVTSDRRTARSVARQWNTALRHTQTMAVVNPDTLAQQFAAYLAVAADPLSGFTPTMKTTLAV